MSENETIAELERAFYDGIIDIDEFESELESVLESNMKGFNKFNTSIGLDSQIWMSDSEDENPSPAQMISVDGEMHLPIKPKGGMWTSTYTPDDEYDSDWIRWCSTEGFYGGRHKWLMKPKPDTTVLVIDSLNDLRTVAKHYEKDTYKGKDASLISDTVLDFVEISKDFDAIRLTEKGQWDTRITSMNEPSLYGWDSECVLHFRWNWTEYDYLGKCSHKVDVPELD